MTTPRLSLHTAAPGIYRALVALAAGAALEPRLRELVRIRASQLNGCAYAWNRAGVATALRAEALA
jgi:alkylhydroperoxidase family enzyme